MRSIPQWHPIRITRDCNGDTRTADHIPSIEEFDKANINHRADVSMLITRFSDLLETFTTDHDFMKRSEPYRSMFYRDMVATMEGRIEFTEGEWAKLHYGVLERHHLMRNVPEDVDLFDVIEMICDCVAAGMARSGEVRPLELSEDVIVKAVDNTVKMLAEQIELVP